MENIRFSIAKRDSHIMSNEVHLELEMYYLKQGQRLYFVENRTFHLTEGSSIFISSNRIHKTSAFDDLPHERMLLMIHPKFIHTMSSIFPNINFSYLLNQSVVIAYAGDPYSNIIANLFERIAELSIEKPFGWEEEVNCHVFHLFLQFYRLLGNSADDYVIQSSRHRKIYEITEYISANMNHIPSLDELCKLFYISKYYLCHSFKQVTGMSVISFLNITRARRACVLLRDEQLTLKQIAESVGLGNVSRFTEVFKRVMGVTPLQYRRHYDQSS